jgi:putative resolvase
MKLGASNSCNILIQYHTKVCKIGYNQLMKIGIREAAKELGVSTTTLRRWDRSGKLVAEKTPTGHRRYSLEQLRYVEEGQKPAERQTIGYARVSTSGQKDDLARQVQMLESFCAAKGWPYQIIQDQGSGLNYNKRGLKKLISQICAGEVGRLVVTHKDRLLRFGSELIFQACEIFHTEVVIINQEEAPLGFEEELAQDVLEIITVFSAKLYGSRSRKNKILLEKLAETANAAK